MIFPKLKELSSPDLGSGTLPTNPEHCSVFLQAMIGSGDASGGDIFSFTAVTPSYLAESNRLTWGRGLLVVPSFSWPTVSTALDRLLIRASRETWEASASELNKTLEWEFDIYQPAKA